MLTGKKVSIVSARNYSFHEYDTNDLTDTSFLKVVDEKLSFTMMTN